MNAALAQAQIDEPRTITLPIEGMTCASCVGRVERALNKTDGVLQVSVNLATERAEVRYDGGRIAPVAVAEAIERTGFTVPSETLTLSIGGMTCASCVGRVERALKKTAGVAAALVNLTTEEARVSAPTGVVAMAALVAAVERAGYAATALVDRKNPEDEAAEAGRRLARERNAVILAGLLTLPLIAQMAAGLAGFEFRLAAWLQLALATPGILRKAPSTRPTQDAQVMPPTDRVRVSYGTVKPVRSMASATAPGAMLSPS